MAFRYRQRYFETGDFATHLDWNVNIAEYIGEFNGYLDRDNLPTNAVVVDRIVDETFNIISADAYDETEPCTINGDLLDWQDGDSSYDIGVLILDVPADGVALVEWSGSWAWLAPQHNDTTCVKFRITVDGATVAESGFSSSRRAYDAMYIVGSVPVQAGNRTFRVQAFNCEIEDDEATLPVSGGTYTATRYAPASVSNRDVTMYARELIATVEIR